MISEWIESSPVSSILMIVIGVLALILVLKIIRSIAKPLLIIIVVVAAVLIFFNLLDLTLLAATGKKLLELIWDKIYQSGVDYIK